MVVVLKQIGTVLCVTAEKGDIHKRTQMQIERLSGKIKQQFIYGSGLRVCPKWWYPVQVFTREKQNVNKGDPGVLCKSEFTR